MADSEKVIEKTLVLEINKQGGWSIKLPCVYVSGLPDRLCFLPGAVIFFIEVKSTGKTASPVQKLIHRKLRRLGFDVYVIDTLKDLYHTLNKYLI